MTPPPVRLLDLNEYIKCKLCGGYLIDATTIVECLHSFCKTCIVKYLDGNNSCPTCDIVIHKTKPLVNLRSDPTLQDIVYKIVPGLFKGEMCRRSHFYKHHPEAAESVTSSEDRGIISGERIIYSRDDKISLSIEYMPEIISYAYLPLSSKCSENSPAGKGERANQRRYLLCEGGMKVLHLKKWLKMKYDLEDNHEIEILYKHDPLSDEYTMIDLAYIYCWRRNGPLGLFYTITDGKKPTKRRLNECAKSEVTEGKATKVKTVSKFLKEPQPNINHVVKASNKKRIAKVIEKLTRNVQLNGSPVDARSDSSGKNGVDLALSSREPMISFSSKLEACTKESRYSVFSPEPDWSKLELIPKVSKVIRNLSEESTIDGVSSNRINRY